METSSLEVCDSNAVMLPAKKNKKRRRKDRVAVETIVKMEQRPKLSNSQKRKLKKLEEENEKAALLSKSIETLGKYKIPDDAYSLLRCSTTIGRAETKLEKRQRVVRFSKMGLAVPPNERSSKEENGYNSSSESEDGSDETKPRKDINLVQPVIVGGEVMNDATKPFQAPQIKANIVSAEAPPGESAPHKDLQAATEQDGNQQLEKACSVPDGTKGSLSSKLPTVPTVVHVSRPDEVENKRKELPIVMMEQEIMEAINDNSTVIICGETGCGKTTQVPQFLYEAGFGSEKSMVRSGMIGVTQPRRVAVLATAKRVAFELGLRLGKEVGFQVRHEKKIGGSCSIKFMTDGILLREVQSDILLRRYSVIILDEAHERSLNTDILIGFLSNVIQFRKGLYEKQQKVLLSGGNISHENTIFPLKLILMSATLRVEDFASGSRLFREPPPVIEVPTRQFPVTLHFSKRTEIVDYIGQAFKKVMSIHKRLPPGGILVFVTGQREVEYLCQKLRNASKELLSRTSKVVGTQAVPDSDRSSVEDINMKDISEAFEVQGEPIDVQTDRFSFYNEDRHDFNEDEYHDSFDSETESELEYDGEDADTLKQEQSGNFDKLTDVLGEDKSLASLKVAFEALARGDALPSNPIEEDSESKIEKKATNADDSTEQINPSNKESYKNLAAGALCVLPLYAMLPAAAQLRVFEEVKEGERLVVVATNVAETSLTIPGIKYVVDTGREKVKNYNPTNGMETYEVQWISKASAAQRAGRAGRTGPGHCYRLYSSAVFSNILPDFSIAEILKVPVDGVVLLLKSMGIPEVSKFPFPTAPNANALCEADRCLKALAALDVNGRLTPLGKAMAYYPMSPRHSRMLLTVIQIMRKVKTYARANLVLGYAVAATAALSSSNPFVMRFEGSEHVTDHSEQETVSVDENNKFLHKEEKRRKNELKEKAKASRAKFSNPSSDALTVAFALQCFELSKSPAEFCNENGLHPKTMEEMSKLRKQLLQLVFNQNSGDDSKQDFLWTHGKMEDVELFWRASSRKNPLLHNEEEILGQAICAGWADRVARRIKAVSALSEGARKVRAAKYQSCIVKETVFLHRWSSLSTAAPEFLVYSELLHTKWAYIHGATSVKPEWLVQYCSSLCSFSAPLLNQKPYYNPQTDEVYCWVIPSFGPHLWQLPLHSLPITDGSQRTAVFAFALLDGQVLPCLRSAKKYIAAPLDTILKRESYGQKRVGNLLRGLENRAIESCDMLKKTWEKSPTFLHSEIRDWFQKSFHEQFDELWLKMLSEVRLEPQERFPKKARKE